MNRDSAALPMTLLLMTMTLTLVSHTDLRLALMSLEAVAMLVILYRVAKNTTMRRTSVPVTFVPLVAGAVVACGCYALFPESTAAGLVAGLFVGGGLLASGAMLTVRSATRKG
ncbi:hypothetical protein [Spirillospora sp. CA-294931]|uniref:hypothetical protein n=1 Tax=Spirillospora sp. CA-294931 TaxID=3240042 RepID=UPI003D909CC0